MRRLLPRQRVRGYTIIVPLNVPKMFHSDYINQTAKILAENNEVLLFDFRNPCSLYSLLINVVKRKKFLHKIAALFRSKRNGIKEFSPLGIFPFQNNKYVYKLNQYLGILQLRLILMMMLRARVGIWGFHPLMALLIGKFHENFSLYDCVDYYGEELTIGKELSRLEQVIFRKITLVSFNSQALFEKKLASNPILKQKGFVAPCGCDVKLFAKTKPKRDILNPIPHPRIGFVGHVNYRFDFTLLKRLATMRPGWSFVLLGPLLVEQAEDFQNKVLDSVNELERLSNVYFLGKITKAVLPEYLKAIDVGIIPYQTRFGSVRYCNPMKAYEYLASGKPVVSTNIPALGELHSELAAVTGNVNQFKNAIETFLSGWNNKKTRRARAVARANSWEKKLSTIENFIIQKMGVLLILV